MVFRQWSHTLRTMWKTQLPAILTLIVLFMKKKTVYLYVWIYFCSRFKIPYLCLPKILATNQIMLSINTLQAYIEQIQWWMPVLLTKSGCVKATKKSKQWKGIKLNVVMRGLHSSFCQAVKWNLNAGLLCVKWL